MKPVVNTKISEDEIRPDDIFNEFMKLSAEDALNFFDKSQFENCDCPGCGEVSSSEAFVKHGFNYNCCANCGTIYASPRPNLTELNRYYARSASQKFWSETILKHTGGKRKQSIMLPNIERIEAILSEKKILPKKVLDIGAGNGTFLTEWKARHINAELHGIEPGQESAQQCRDFGITTYESSVEEAAEKKQIEGNLVTCFEVIEHVQNPQRFAEAIFQVTAPNGIAVMSCLGADGFDIQVLWDKSRSLMPPYHLNFMSQKGMKTLFEKSGFKSVEISTPGRLDVDIVLKSLERAPDTQLSRFEKLLLSKGQETRDAFQQFLAKSGLSSHVWIICQK